MNRHSEKGQLLNWFCKRYFRFLLLGAMTSCAFFNLALHSSTGLYYYCEEECILKLLNGPIATYDSDVISHVRSYYVDPPHPKGSFKGNKDFENPPWAKLGKWGEIHKFISNYFKGYREPGHFVEIGAQDGEFMSLSLWLEQIKGFTGLLIEPNPVDYPKLRAMGRSAYSINACANPAVSHAKEVLWLRDIPSSLPPLLTRIQEGSNRLLKYVATEDRDLGKEITVQCFNAGAMIAAALKTVQIDFLSISTHGGELDVLDSLSRQVQIRCLAIVAPLASETEYQSLIDMTKDRGLTEALAKGNIHVFIPSNEVKIVAKSDLS